ncbi:MAG: precorrin-6A/cobalt-precorrin-6A reductase [Alphaproteobacteria bacterium]|nr:precorrin-6A/cobalt-precorrin-6A reductase [Alphaproteobacteria bacterium]
MMTAALPLIVRQNSHAMSHEQQPLAIVLAGGTRDAFVLAEYIVRALHGAQSTSGAATGRATSRRETSLHVGGQRRCIVYYMLAGHTPSPRIPPGTVPWIKGSEEDEAKPLSLLNDRVWAERNVVAVIDATHVFAVRFHVKLKRFAQRLGLPLGVVRRGLWEASEGDDWRAWCQQADLAREIAAYCARRDGWHPMSHQLGMIRIAVALGGRTMQAWHASSLALNVSEDEAPQSNDNQADKQGGNAARTVVFVWRCFSTSPALRLRAAPRHSTITVAATDSVTLERQRLESGHIDAVIMRNSGGDASALLTATRQLAIPVFMQYPDHDDRDDQDGQDDRDDQDDCDEPPAPYHNLRLFGLDDLPSITRWVTDVVFHQKG